MIRNNVLISIQESEGETEILIDTPSSTLSEESPSESDVQVSSSSSQTGLSQPKTLQQEFSLINVNIRNISFEKVIYLFGLGVKTFTLNTVILVKTDSKAEKF